MKGLTQIKSCKIQADDVRRPLEFFIKKLKKFSKMAIICLTYHIECDIIYIQG